MKDKFVVLCTGGKGEDLYTVKVKVFDDEEDAKKYCKENTDDTEEKYWNHAEIIEEDHEYEVERYKNHY